MGTILCIRLTHTFIGFLTLKSDFCQVGDFEESVWVIGLSVLNRKTPNQIGRVEKHSNGKIVDCSKLSVLVDCKLSVNLILKG